MSILPSENHRRRSRGTRRLVIGVLMAMLAILPLTGCASPTPSNPGFYLTSHPGTPEGVRTASGSVYRMLVFPPDKRVIVPRERIETVVKAVRELEGERGLRPQEQHVFEVLARHLQESGQTAANLGVVSYGTAFLHGDRRTIWTNRHVIESHMKLEPGQRAHVVLLDGEDRVVFDGREGSGTATIQTIGRPDAEYLSDVSEWALRSLASDHATLRLDRELPHAPIALSPLEPVAGTPAFLLGFPSIGTGREVGAPDRQTLRYGKGVVLGPSSRRFEHKGKTISRGDPDYRRHVLTTSADTNSGASGGPIVDERGRLLGLSAVGIKREGSSSSAVGPRSIFLLEPAHH